MLLMIAALALAGGDADPAEPVKKDDPLICKRDNNLATGSHFQSKRVCKLKSEWEFIENYTQQQLRKIDDRRKRIPEKTGMGARDSGG